MRRRLIVGNWKMNKTASEAALFVEQLSEILPDHPQTDVVVAPPFTALHAAAQAMGGAPSFSLAGQNVCWEDRGAFTGEISGAMLKDVGCRYVIVGHSERRRLFGEDDAAVNKKVRAALRHGLRPIVCVGESLSEREREQTNTVVGTQIRHALHGLTKEELAYVIIAYEPVWAIGTGRAASSAQATAVHAMLRTTVSDGWAQENGDAMRILYGGSVTPENAADLFSSDQIDGALVGGACLDPQCFATIVSLAQTVEEKR